MMSEYDDEKWAELMDSFDDTEPIRKAVAGTVVDVACLANVLCRTILLLDTSPSPHVEVFVPFLRTCGQCCSPDEKKRSPSVLAWADQAQTEKVAMVAAAKFENVVKGRFDVCCSRPKFFVPII